MDALFAAGMGVVLSVVDEEEDKAGAKEEGRCARLPRRCISLETSLAS